MKRISLSAIFAVAILAIATQAQADTTHENPMNELEGFSNAKLTFGVNKNTEFTIGAGYARTLTDLLQASSEIQFLTRSAATALDLMVGPTFNIALDDMGIRNAIYITAMAGIALERLTTTEGAEETSETSTHLAYKAAVGKRFEVWPDIAWKPEFNISGTNAHGVTPTYSLVPVQFAFTF